MQLIVYISTAVKERSGSAFFWEGVMIWGRGVRIGEGAIENGCTFETSLENM